MPDPVAEWLKRLEECEARTRTQHNDPHTTITMHLGDCSRLLRVARAWHAAKNLVDSQAEDDGLWFVAQTAPEAYLQQELRKLHAAIEQDKLYQGLDTNQDNATYVGQCDGRGGGGE